MCKFIIELKNKYVMSFIDDYLPTSTNECESLEESVYEMEGLFDQRIKNPNNDITKSMKDLYECSESGQLLIELIGINLIDSNPVKERITDRFNMLAKEYLDNLHENKGIL